MLWWKDCSMMWPLLSPLSWTQARQRLFPTNHPERLADHNWCSLWHKSGPFPCLLWLAISWKRPLSWPGQACKVIFIPGSIHVLVFLIIPPTRLLPYIILWHLSGAAGIHSILQPPKICLVCKFPLMNSTNYQTGVRSLFHWSFLALPLGK